MKPLKLIMKNIASFTGEHSIDFSLLGDMFLICGKTGAGKSTVLDAITYALYGSLPGARKQNDIRRLRSDFCGSKDESFVHFEFQLNTKRYRIERNLPVSRITRNGKLKEDGESAALFLQEKDGENLLCDKKNETDNFIRSLISLSADEFSRIILLPQGDFADFLRQNSTERKAMLSKLFPVERFARTTEALKNERARLASMHEEVMKNLERIAPGFSTDEDETLQIEHKKRLKLAEKQSEDLRTSIFKLKLEIDETEKTERALIEYSEVQNELKALTERTEEYEKIKQTASAIRFALAVEPLLSAAEQAHKNLNRTEAELEDCSTRLALCTQTKIDLTQSEQRQKENQKRLGQNALDMQKTELALAAASDMKKARIEAVGTEENLKKSRLQTEKIREQVREVRQAEERQRELSCECEKERANLQYADYMYLKAREAELSLREKSLQTTVERARLILEQLLTEKEAEERLSQAYILAVHLEESKPCPVCGSTEHPRPAQKNTQIPNTEEKIQTQKELTAEAEKNLTAVQDEKKELRGRIHQSRSRLYEQNPVQPCEGQKDIYEDPGCEGKDDTIPSAAEAGKKCDDIRVRLFSLTQALQEAEKKAVQKDSYEEDLRQAEKYCAECEKENAAILARLSEAEKLVNSLLDDTNKTPYMPLSSAAHTYETVFSTIQKTAEKLYTERLKLEEDIRRYNEQSSQAEKLYAELTGTIGALEADKKIRIKEYQRSLDAFNEAADKAPYEALKTYDCTANRLYGEYSENKEVRRTQCKNLIKELIQNRQAAEHRAENLEHQVQTYNSQKQRLEVLCGEKKAALSAKYGDFESANTAPQELFSAEDFEKNNTALIRLKAEREKLLDKQSEAENRLTENEAICTELRRVLAETEARLNEYKNLEKRRLELSEKLHVYTRLYDAVSGKNPNKLPLESWVLRMYLEEVCLCAGRRLERISDGRYTLYLKKPEGGKGFQGLDLEIYDSYTGKRRPCSTLSGGETFMASISLALAVSDTVQAKNGGIQLDSLFIDEGFGSLDETTLDKALSVLDEIRGSRCIGLVSHVGLLKTRIPARLEIEKGISGSRIKTVQG